MFKNSPAIFAVADEYQIMVLTDEKCVMWARIGDENYFDDSNGILRVGREVHRMCVPMGKLNREKKYTICARRVEQTSFHNCAGDDIIEQEYDFYPVPDTNPRAYQLADTHDVITPCVNACEFFGKIDFLIMNGDIHDGCYDTDSLYIIYEIAEKLTHGNIPIVFARGNHGLRDKFAEKLEEYEPTYNGNSYYTFKLGRIWGIVLDCGEDKADECDAYHNSIICHSFRKRQTDFIKRVIENAKTEYLCDDIDYRMVVVHIPFTEQLAPPFNIEKEIYLEWSKLIKDNIKPDIMMSGHCHWQAINEIGGEKDHLGQPCTVVVGSKFSHTDKSYYAGCGLKFENASIEVVFNDSEKVLNKHIITLMDRGKSK